MSSSMQPCWWTANAKCEEAINTSCAGPTQRVCSVILEFLQILLPIYVQKPGFPETPESTNRNLK